MLKSDILWQDLKMTLLTTSILRCFAHLSLSVSSRYTWCAAVRVGAGTECVYRTYLTGVIAVGI